VLEILAARNVRATFFPIGKWIDRWPRAFDRIVHAGHVVGNHSYLHDPDAGDFDRAAATIAHVTGRPSRFLRVPYFRYDLLEQTSLTRSGTVKIVDSDVNPGDWLASDPFVLARGVLESPHQANGSIIDLHDGSELADDAARLDRPLSMLAALPMIVDGLLERGLSPVGLDELELVPGEPSAPTR
jgi:peptidoglycan/xylan/chitin deacetylase (PgdA/CDA1 family)